LIPITSTRKQLIACASDKSAINYGCEKKQTPNLKAQVERFSPNGDVTTNGEYNYFTSISAVFTKGLEVSLMN